LAVENLESIPSQQVQEKQSSLGNENSTNKTISTEPECLTVEKLLQLAKNDQFPMRVFIINNQKKLKTPISHFFKTKSVFNENLPESMEFKCKICQKLRICPFGDLCW
jgi:hypothetical protein